MKCLGKQIATIHNLSFYLWLVREARKHILAGTFLAGKQKWYVKWNLDCSMKLIDFYIIKRYIGTFLVMILLFIPIGIMVDVAEKIDKFKEKEVPLADSHMDYYIDFTWYFANLLFPIFYFYQ